MTENLLISCWVSINTHYMTKNEKSAVKMFFLTFVWIIFCEYGWFQKLVFLENFGSFLIEIWVKLDWNLGEIWVKPCKRYNFKLEAWVENRDGKNFVVSSSSWRNLKLSDYSYGFDLLRPKNPYIPRGLIHQYPEMNNYLVVSIQSNQLNVFAVDALRVTAAAWCLNSENGMVISEDAFLTFEEAKVFCQSRNSTLWVPKSDAFLEDSKFFDEFESRKVRKQHWVGRLPKMYRFG